MEMKRKNILRCHHDEYGAILVEYVLLVCLAVTMIYVLFIDQFYSPITGFQGMLGNALKGVMQHVLEGIAMPVP